MHALSEFIASSILLSGLREIGSPIATKIGTFPREKFLGTLFVQIL
jgi:hypothetical protein